MVLNFCSMPCDLPRSRSEAEMLAKLSSEKDWAAKGLVLRMAATRKSTHSSSAKFNVKLSPRILNKVFLARPMALSLAPFL